MRFLDAWLHAARGKGKRTTHVPQVLLDVLPSDVALVINEVRYVEKFVFFFFGVAVGFDDCSWDDAWRIVLAYLQPYFFVSS